MKKVLLLHGWNYINYTNVTTKKDAWHNRQDFVDKLEREFIVYKLNFPGFCGQMEPNDVWELKDYANYVNLFLKKNKLKVDYIIGYSFGGAVAIMYNTLYNYRQKLILISPAIVRNTSKSKKFIKTPEFIKPLRNKLRYLYLKYIIKNKYYVYGTKFLNESYQNIVRVELMNEVHMIDPRNIDIIYGSVDNMVNPDYVINNIESKYIDSIHVIEGGNHDIANTHTDELIEIIKKIGA